MITVLFGGSRPEGNTAELTRYALDGLDYTWVMSLNINLILFVM